MRAVVFASSFLPNSDIGQWQYRCSQQKRGSAFDNKFVMIETVLNCSDMFTSCNSMNFFQGKWLTWFCSRPLCGTWSRGPPPGRGSRACWRPPGRGWSHQESTSSTSEITLDHNGNSTSSTTWITLYYHCRSTSSTPWITVDDHIRIHKFYIGNYSGSARQRSTSSHQELQ